MDRRTFLVRVGAGMVAAPAVLTLKACGDDVDPAVDSSVSDGDTDSTTPETSFTANASLGGHTHTVTVECDDLSDEGVTYTSSLTSGHTHQVVITAEELAMIANGDEVIVQTTDEGHVHSWAIQKPESACA